MLAVDLFAGTGAATRAFVDAGWRVVTVDLVPPRGARRREWLRPGRLPIAGDVRALPLQIAEPVDFLWASPPCTDFSDANPARPARPSLELVVAALEAVAQLRPRFWILENVRGAIPFLGIPVQKVGPWCLWGYFPALRVSLDMQLHRKTRRRSAVARATVPYALSHAALTAVELYRDVGSLLDLRPFRRHRHRALRAPALPMLPLDPQPTPTRRD
jgi:C-5 cytosine-specific DNA methylase